MNETISPSLDLIVDTDVGSDVDDAMALALLLGSPEVSVASIVTVYGDPSLRARIATGYLRLSRRAPRIRVLAGEGVPLSGAEVWWAGHERGLFADLRGETVESGGVAHLVDAVGRAPGCIDVLAIGPLTNIAAALALDPLFAQNVRRLVIMGGDFQDTDRVPEHNFRADVVAAQKVFASGMPVLLGGLDVTTQVRIDAGSVEAIARAGELGAALARDIRQWWEHVDEVVNIPHDPLVALAMIEPELFTTERVVVEVDDDGRSWERPHREGNVSLLRSVRSDAALRSLLDRVVRGA